MNHQLYRYHGQLTVGIRVPVEKSGPNKKKKLVHIFACFGTIQVPSTFVSSYNAKVNTGEGQTSDPWSDLTLHTFKISIKRNFF